MRRRRRRSLRRLTRSRRSRARQGKNKTAKPLGNPVTQRRAAKARQRAMLGSPPDMASSLARISKDISRKAARWETACFRRLKPMRSPDIGYARRPSPSGCRGYNICFGTAVGNPASQSQRLRRTCAMPVRPPGIFASARRKGTRFASAAHRA